MRSEILELQRLGQFPVTIGVPAESIPESTLIQQEQILLALKPPFTDDELRVLLTLFGPDDYFGLAQTLMHRIEASPQWLAVADTLLAQADQNNEWIQLLRTRIENARNRDNTP